MTAYATVEAFAERVQTLRSMAGAAGREPESIDTGIETYVCVAATRADALRIAERSLRGKFKDLDAGLDSCIVGSVDEVMEKIDRYRMAGARHAELKFICHDVAQLQRMMELVAGAQSTLG
jgi:alkanesulfonate monooxygenase SsuD/methylene tetrahydromethanopterin reductase-like flavin-dependent oxidoreductase (luciferase family)